MKKYVLLFVIAGITFCIQSFLGKKGPADKAALGELLFSDPILSRDKTISCASCHIPAYAFADTLAVSRGVGKRKGTRNAPSSMNMRLQNIFFWDGRAKTLEEQALAPIENHDEMDLSIEEAVARLQNSETYSRYFKEIFNDVPGRANLAEAIAAFERTLETSDSPFDNWKFMDDSAAVSSAAKRGFALFNGKAKCVNCHFGADFTRHEFRNIGLFDGRKLNDSGRAVISKDKNDIGKFKIPGLRNVAITAPYMHNGMFTTLKEVIEFYNDPGKVVPRAINRDTAMAKPLGLTLREKKDLEAFLRSLTDKRFVRRKN